MGTNFCRNAKSGVNFPEKFPCTQWKDSDIITTIQGCVISICLKKGGIFAVRTEKNEKVRALACEIIKIQNCLLQNVQNNVMMK